ncbi:hypothetical protein B0H16DRAFT_1475267 [Mycena metata]|uniref:Uncharacterized protein n=1 Tax=Mycena metata TaxID=1033252 RepID=A0AAD7HEI5_9AGAR|nr:hypothetical protein B0H16DRAFT_1475267 [Mycena metata]
MEAGRSETQGVGAGAGEDGGVGAKEETGGRCMGAVGDGGREGCGVGGVAGGEKGARARAWVGAWQKDARRERGWTGSRARDGRRYEGVETAGARADAGVVRREVGGQGTLGAQSAARCDAEKLSKPLVLTLWARALRVANCPQAERNRRPDATQGDEWASCVDMRAGRAMGEVTGWQGAGGHRGSPEEAVDLVEGVVAADQHRP